MICWNCTSQYHEYYIDFSRSSFTNLSYILNQVVFTYYVKSAHKWATYMVSLMTYIQWHPHLVNGTIKSYHSRVHHPTIKWPHYQIMWPHYQIMWPHYQIMWLHYQVVWPHCQIVWPYELTMRFGCESVRLIPRDLGKCPRERSHQGQWAKSQAINPNSHPKQVDNSGSVTTVLVTKCLYNDAKCLFLFERWVLFLSCQPSLLFWSCDTNRPIIIKKMFFWDHCPARWL